MATKNALPDDVNSVSLRVTGVMLTTISALAVVALLHHPTAHGKDAAAVLTSLRGQAVADRFVHGALALIYGLLATGMGVFASRLGVWRLPVLLGLVSFSCALVLLVLAAMTDGFIAPALAERCATSASCTAEAPAMLAFGAMQIEFLTRFGLVAIAIAVLSWSTALLLTHEAPRWPGVSGLAAGLLQVAALLLTPGVLTPHNLLFITAGQIAWYLIVAALMISGRLPCGTSTNGPLVNVGLME